MIALKTMLYSPSDFASMDSPASMALTDRMNGIFAALEIPPEKFTAAYELAIGEHVEKNYKGLSYLSWPFAFRHLKEQFPTFFVSFEESSIGWPVFGKEGCWLLRPFLTDGCRRTPALVFPLMDNKHNALVELNARAVSDNIQRASVKCIATFTGLGLKLYSGEDIPKSDEKESAKLPLQQETTKPTPSKATAMTSLSATSSLKMRLVMATLRCLVNFSVQCLAVKTLKKALVRLPRSVLLIGKANKPFLTNRLVLQRC